jgi:recombinational DNA repair protein (RecF pathway)
MKKGAPKLLLRHLLFAFLGIPGFTAFYARDSGVIRCVIPNFKKTQSTLHTALFFNTL